MRAFSFIHGTFGPKCHVQDVDLVLCSPAVDAFPGIESFHLPAEKQSSE